MGDGDDDRILYYYFVIDMICYICMNWMHFYVKIYRDLYRGCSFLLTSARNKLYKLVSRHKLT